MSLARAARAANGSLNAGTGTQRKPAQPARGTYDDTTHAKTRLKRADARSHARSRHTCCSRRRRSARHAAHACRALLELLP
eukprot:2755868-Prymnesium_polylepis.1